jgi:threonyl-tRNA synthetase
MSLPERFELTYIGEDGTPHRPIMIHRALFGSIERFFGILVEHYAGKFPLWLSPVHLRILPVAERHYDAAEAFAHELKKKGLRVEVDQSSESVNKKVRNAQLAQVNYISVFGDKEAGSENLTIRTRDNQVHPEISREAFAGVLLGEYRSRASSSLLIDSE